MSQEQRVVVNRRQVENMNLIDVVMIEPMILFAPADNQPPQDLIEERSAFQRDADNFLNSDDHELDVSTHVRYISFLAHVFEQQTGE